MGDWRIASCHGRWQLVGEYWTDGLRGGLRGRAAYIRRWGTEHGLGQLQAGPACEGKYAPTLLDPCTDPSWPLVCEGPSLPTTREVWINAISEAHEKISC
jgi:hypothetical protein